MRFIAPLIAACCLSSVAVAGQSRGLIAAPSDRPESITVGPLLIETFNPVTITPIENSTDIYFTITNRSPSDATLQLDWTRLQAAKPSWMDHLYKFFGYESPGEPAVMRLAANERRVVKFYVSKDDVPPESRVEARLPFDFRVVETRDQGTLNLTLVADDRGRDFFATPAATISGRVTSGGQPVANAIVTAGVLADRAGVSARTGADGSYRLSVVSIDDVKLALGERPLPYDSVTYFVTVEADGYSLGYQGGLTPGTGQTVTQDFSLDRVAGRTYTQVGELATTGDYGYWWMRFFGDDDRVVAVQGQHMDEPKAGHIIAVDLTGHELWRVPTDDQCWGLDVSAQSRTIVAGCYDGYLYIVGFDGRLAHKLHVGDRPGPGRVVSAQLSPDGTRVLVDGASGAGGFSMIDVASGRVLWTSTNVTPVDEQKMWAYKSRWSPDGQMFVAGNFGAIIAFAADGRALWRTHIGESPLYLAIDAAHNVYAAGKNRELTSWDANGAVRWSHRIAHTSNAMANELTADGAFTLVPTFNGLIQAFATDGRPLWERWLPQIPDRLGAPGSIPRYGPGHNATAMTPSADVIAIGTRGFQLVVYDRNGTELWRHSASARATFTGPPPAYPGADAVAVSRDGRYIAAGYSDSVIRIFKRAE